MRIITMTSCGFMYIRERVRVSTMRILVTMTLVILLLLANVAQARAEDDPALGEFAQKIQTVVNHIGKWEMGQAKALVLSLKRFPGESTEAILTRLEEIKNAVTTDFGALRECRFVRSSAVLDFACQYYYAMVFERKITSVIFTGYRVNGKWELIGFSLATNYDQLYLNPIAQIDQQQNEAFLDPKMVEKGSSPIDRTVASLAKLYADGKVEEQVDFMAAHGFAKQVEINKMVGESNELRAKHITLQGNPIGVRLVSKRTVGSMLRVYKYTVLLEHGFTSVAIEVVQLKEGEWTLSRINGGVSILP